MRFKLFGWGFVWYLGHFQSSVFIVHIYVIHFRHSENEIRFAIGLDWDDVCRTGASGHKSCVHYKFNAIKFLFVQFCLLFFSSFIGLSLHWFPFISNQFPFVFVDFAEQIFSIYLCFPFYGYFYRFQIWIKLNKFSKKLFYLQIVVASDKPVWIQIQFEKNVMLNWSYRKQTGEIYFFLSWFLCFVPTFSCHQHTCRFKCSFSSKSRIGDD